MEQRAYKLGADGLLSRDIMVNMVNRREWHIENEDNKLGNIWLKKHFEGHIWNHSSY
jgi:hypothetical protein